MYAKTLQIYKGKRRTNQPQPDENIGHRKQGKYSIPCNRNEILNF